MKPGVTETLRKQRVEYAISLKQAGMTSRTILSQINSLAEKNGWGEITSRTLRRDFSSYYAENLLISNEEKVDQRWERESHIEEMDKIIEKMSIELADKSKSWKPFEKPALMRDLFDMKMKLAELQNWNYGRFNPLHKTELKSDNALMEMGLKNLIQDHPAKDALIAGIDNLLTALPKDGSEVDLEALHKTTYRSRAFSPQSAPGHSRVGLGLPEEQYSPETEKSAQKPLKSKKGDTEPSGDFSISV